MNKLIIGMLIMLVLVTACSTRQPPAAPAAGGQATVVQDTDAAIAAVNEADALADPEAEQQLDELQAVLEQVQ
ncbi:hypothetical protein HY491_03165 [Candidatus Woesearchaeota archaeon]|nr:hypothetical protein [Candidatus Woesearchaeota archaeon]